MTEAELAKQVDDLLRRASGRDAAVARMAARDLTNLGAVALPRLIKIVQQERWLALLRFVGAYAVTAVAISALAEVVGLGKVSSGLTVAGMSIGGLFAVSRRQRMAIWLLGEAADKRAIGPLLHTYQSGSGYRIAHSVVGPPLVRLLRAMTPEDRNLLAPNERAHLRLCVVAVDVQLAAAAVHALSQIGDTQEDAAVLRKLAAGKAGRGKRRHADLRRAAEAALKAVEERIPVNRLSRTLLRPASDPANPAEILVRPAPAGASSDTATLLRPAPSPEPDETDSAVSNANPVNHIKAQS
ncbi:MAG: hypothetical protein NT029_18910 [Armatimonadetes bacterium]|nr:hypothetical protein [Armatimonadota bacterium]